MNQQLTAELFLPLHLGKQCVGAAEEVADFAVLIVSLGWHVHAMSRLLRQILTDLWDRKHDLLKSSVVSDNLDLSRVCCIVVEGRVNLKLTVVVHLCRTQLLRQLLAVFCQLNVTLNAKTL